MKNLSPEITETVALYSMSFDAGFAEEFAGYSIQELAHAYADEILRSELSEPLVLFGASFGGFLAYETSHILVQRGCDIRVTILNDTAVPWPHRSYKKLRRFAFNVRSVGLHLSKPRSLFRNASAERLFVVPEFGQLNLEPLHEKCHDVARHSFLALSKYQPSRANIPMLLFAAEYRNQGRIPMDPDLGWSKFNSGTTLTILLGKDHFSVLGDDATASVAAQHINSFLDEVGANHA